MRISSCIKIIFLLSVQFTWITAKAQNQRKIDSLETLALKHPNDTTGAKILNNLIFLYNGNSEYRKALSVGKRSLELSKKFDLKKNIANALTNMGVSYFYLGQTDSSLLMHTEALEIRRKINDLLGLSKSYVNIGLYYQNTGKYSEAIDYMNKGIAICEQNKFFESLANSYINLANVYYYVGDRSSSLEYLLKALSICERDHLKAEESVVNNIGVIYAEAKEYDKALTYFLKSLKLSENSGSKVSIAAAYSNISGIYGAMDQFDKALEYSRKSLAIDLEIGNKPSLANGYGNMAGILLYQEKFDSALKYVKKAYALNTEMGQKDGIQSNETALAKIYLATGNTREAERFALNASKIANEIGYLKGVSETELTLSDIYTKMGKPALALDHYKAHVVMRDSLHNSENTREITQKEMNYQFNKEREKQKAEQERKEIESALMHKQQRITIFSVIAGLILVIIFSLFLYKRYRITQKQNEIIQNKNKQIEEQNKEIIDSITYAKRLQDAILPTIVSIQSVFPKSFVLYKPKAIVAGDFYWAEKINDLFFIAAADSTGHGVPGAIVSVVCSNALNRSVKEFHLTDTGEILDKTRELVLETFDKSGEDVKDGMDISLMCIHTKTKQINWSGANNPLWYVHNNEMKEIKADKQPIGKTDVAKPFSSHTLKDTKDMTFFLFTDGLADQFGGPHGKKFKYKQFSEILLNNAHLSEPQQMEIINKKFDDWKGKLEQVDDVCVIGIKL
jgi:tetratricopeptide (TPR) repeat protein/serine phosphatase RsbU (regulator of sigma subunit)